MTEVEFGGVVGRTISESQPWWPAPPQAPAGSPNVVCIVFDDMGFADLGCYGSEIQTPNIDRLAEEGIRYSNFHTTALCSPTRASLLTGRNHHSVGMAGLANWDMGFPGARGSISPRAATLAEMLRPQGYNTFAVGKWHLTPMAEISAAGPFDQWPLQRGFDRFYGFLEGETNQWHPELTCDNHPIEAPTRPGYHLTEDLVDQSIGFIRGQQSVAPGKPFFLYLAFGACHAPHQAPGEFIEKYVPVFEKGWDLTREERLARQKHLGLVPADTQLAPRNEHVRPWDTLSTDEQRLYVRFQAAYAGMLEHADLHTGRLLAELDSLQLSDNTMVVLLSDNGASQEGSPFGTVNALRYFNGVRDSLDNNLAHIDEIGQGHLNNNYPLGWAMAGNTPLKRYKQNTHGGGVRDPLIMRWPRRIAARGEVRPQFHHVTDIVPTILEAIGLSAPVEVHGLAQQPVEGTSLAYTWDSSAGPSRKPVQYFEMLGHRGIWKDGWKAVTWHRSGAPFGEDSWELYHLDSDFSECTDLSQEHPGKLQELVAAWTDEAERYSVFPLDDRRGRWTSGNPYHPAERAHWVLYPGSGRIPGDVSPDVRNRSYSITAEVELPAGGAEGVLLAMGDSCGGYAFYLKDGHLIHDYNYLATHNLVVSDRPLPVGPCSLRFEMERTGEASGRGTLFIDGVAAGSAEIPVVYRARTSFIGLEVGRSAQPAVGEFEAPFAFTGVLHRVVVDLVRDQSPDEEGAMRAQLRRQ